MRSTQGKTLIFLFLLGEDHNFAKYSRGESDDFSQNYDLGSIMHYGRLSFSKNGKPTIQAIDNPNQKLGQRDKLSVEDVIQLNKLYRCEGIYLFVFILETHSEEYLAR